MQIDFFSHDRYVIRKQVFKIFGAAFHIYDPQGQLLAYCKLKAFKLKEDLRLYTDENMTSELMVIKARNIIDFGATYDVQDPTEEEPLGSLRRHGFTSMVRDKWVVMDPAGQEICEINEDSLVNALVRRFGGALAMFFPQKFTGTVAGQPVLEFNQNFNPFIHKIALDFSADHDQLLDRRLGIAAAILLCAIEGRQR